VVTVAVTLVTKPKPVSELQGLVYGMANTDEDQDPADKVWYRSPTVLAVTALGLTSVLSLALV